MEIFFNELSVFPTVGTNDLARKKIIALLETMKSLKEFGFNILRVHDNFYGENLSSDYTFSSFFNDSEVSNVQKLLLMSLVKNPFIADEDSFEAEMFINNKFETIDHLGNSTSPEGVAISFVHEVPTLSLSGFPLWDENYIRLNVTQNAANNSSIENVINISNSNSVNTNPEFIEWVKRITAEDTPLNSYENIIKVFPLDKYEFDARAINEIISWYYDDKRYITRIKNLIEDIRNAPFVGGAGLTENLGGGQASKRIVKKDRVVYTVLDKKIIIHSCKKHYNDK
ncbi:type II toxin-antitoxin system YoeB family toxin [Flavobacterium ustbae]|uniref:type II toxin-antitoxin system YoeB family toxin n=1 Tax=Flavobacterium ustbae TaxID=2488790 RepID=UPI0019D2B7A1|nr:type II toxin-antitoxin system YoeB family toxin [Flavobacterium ustbae]